VKTLAHAHDAVEIGERLGRLRPDSARRFGRMSAHQMACHLADNFRMALGHKSVCVGASRLQRTILKWVVLYVPLRWPAGIPTSPEVDQERDGTRPLEFSADVAQVLALLGQVAQAGRGLASRAHPVFGPMSEADWLRWAYLHTDHHLRQFGL
jgi:hypothetical protein